jgi:hypothetical protein
MPHHFAQAPPHAIALHGIADLPRYGEADPRRFVFVFAVMTGLGTLACLQDEGAGRRSRTLGGSLKVRPALQPLH